jgi:hypothetical protein
MRSPLLAAFAAAIVVSLCAPVRADLIQGFDDITTLSGQGWSLQNLSSPVGVVGWFQGNDAVFPSQSGATTSYIGTNFNNGAGTATLSNWLITPTQTLNNGDTISFFTRTVDAPAFPDRLELRLSTNGASTNVGATATSVGDFTTLLLTVNPTLTTSDYPNAWTQFTVTLSGLAAPVSGRVAFRYFVTDGGPAGDNSDYIGIDTFSLHSAAVPEPASIVLVGLGAFGVVGAGWTRRRRSAQAR